MKKMKRRLLLLIIISSIITTKFPDAPREIFLKLEALSGTVSTIYNKVIDAKNAISSLMPDTLQKLEGNANKIPESSNDVDLEMHFLNVGQGDSVLIKCGDEWMLIDAGDNDKGTWVQNYLKKQGVDSLKYLVLTHPDADHIGGADVIINKFEIGEVLMTDFEKETRTYEDVVYAIEHYRTNKAVVKETSEYKIGSANVTVYPPFAEYDDANNNSLIVLVEHGENSFLLMGDAEELAESDLLKKDIVKDVDVLKVGHHGSKTSTSEEFLKIAMPEYAVICCGENNDYGHPHAATLNLLRANAIKVFRTDEQGSIIATSDGSAITWNCAPSESWQAGE